MYRGALNFSNVEKQLRVWRIEGNRKTEPYLATSRLEEVH